MVRYLSYDPVFYRYGSRHFPHTRMKRGLLELTALTTEHKTEEKQLKQAIKDVSNAEKQEAHAQKVEHGSYSVSRNLTDLFRGNLDPGADFFFQTHDKLAKEEQKLAVELHKLTSSTFCSDPLAASM